jgi:leucyl-tRNA synthetase
MDYNFREAEKKWQKYWADNKIYKTGIDHSKPKYYVLDMFPYPSGAGLHVGHPLGYIASDIFARYKRLKGFNVLHPMGYDAYGLPAEQYAIQTGTHPAITTEKNISRYREQLDKIGFSYDWSREVRTSDPDYYKWTQWTFIKLFHSWFDRQEDKAKPIEKLIAGFAAGGNRNVKAACNDETPVFTAEEWNSYNERQQEEILMCYRLAYLADTVVNWCPALGTVLANDEVSEGYSVRGGHPVERKKMKQWLLRITAYADRLLNGLNTIDWSESLKEIQRNWIGRSEGGNIRFEVAKSKAVIEVFTTRPDTIFGATFMVLAPEHELVAEITAPEQKEKVEAYVAWAKNRSERERMTEVKKVSGEFTGAYALNPFTGTKIPVWIADYVLMGYGTGAIMAVPAHDSRDFSFARHFSLPIVQVVNKPGNEPSDPATWEESYDSHDGFMINSGFINGLEVKQAITAVIRKAEQMEIGTGTVNFRLRDAIFSRQRYWGEPFPVFYKDGMPYTLPESELPLLLPEVDAYLPTETGEPPLARAKKWVTAEGYPLETNTMPGFAGSSGYYLRYMDPWNNGEYFSDDAAGYWKNVDLYIGGAEHATGHLIYSRFWNKFLFDMGLSKVEEPFAKLINQGMIQGRSNFVYRVIGTNKFVSLNLRNEYQAQALHVDVNLVENDILDIEQFKNWRPDFADAEFILENGKYICGWEIEKMSKSTHNVVNPDDLIDKYGADTLRLYEMFLGPLEQSKPWDTSGIEGVSRFVRKFWRLFHNENLEFCVSDEAPSKEELKVLHKTIRKIQEDIERFSFNTAVSAFMICTNELTDLKCNKRSILEELVVLISPYAPHMAEELWHLLGNTDSVCRATFPEFNPAFTIDSTFTYPVSFNGKTRFMLELPLDMAVAEIEKAVLAAPESQKWLGGNPPRKVIVVPKKIVNVVI